ncbi:hypothetical protein AAFF_G00070520 [Aldrovandia affinis]|uniref:Allorecognition 1 n=1 Tax=Aldrovandia affinis TaxID=143900 RepID=A0AAD7WDL3_9TELE|nr:hypothetical protein AAFF_G00070520 [Aldrovandia affinis]
MQSIFYTTLLLFVSQLDYVILQSDTEGQLKKPEISANNNNDGIISISCKTNDKSGTNISCNLYTGDASKLYTTTWTLNEVCNFEVNLTGLQMALLSVSSREISCGYTVSTDPRFLSPRSDRYTIPGPFPVSSTSFKALTASSTPTFGTTTSYESNEKSTLPLPLISRTGSSTTQGTSDPSKTALTTSLTSLNKITLTAGSRTTHQSTLTTSFTSLYKTTLTAGSRTTHQSRSSTTQGTSDPSKTALTTSFTSLNKTTLTAGSRTTHQSTGIWAVGMGSAVGMVLLAVTAVCLYRRHKKQKWKRQTDLKNQDFYTPVRMENILSAGDTPGGDRTYAEINDAPSTFKCIPSDAPVRMENILSAGDTPGGDRIYAEINDAPSTFKCIPSGSLGNLEKPSGGAPGQNYTYSLITAVPTTSKLPLSDAVAACGNTPTSTNNTPARGPTTTDAPHSMVYSTLQMH